MSDIEWMDQALCAQCDPEEFFPPPGANVPDAMHRCPIRHDQEADVIAWLHSERVAGHLRKTWAPILDASPAGGTLDLSNLASDVDYWRDRAQAAERHVERLEARS